MPDAPAPAPAPAPREHGWRRVLIALAAFLLVPHVPGMPSVLPVVDTLVLLVPVIAACCVVGWLRGGSALLAVVWIALAAWIALLPAPAGASAAYYDLARAWGLLVAGAFGVTCLTGRDQSFLPRALSALGIAAFLSLALMSAARLHPGEAVQVFGAEFSARNATATTVMQQSARMIAERAPGMADMANDVVAQRVRVQDVVSRGAAPLFPALLALEGLAACALAWAMYHRISRARLGAALAPLKRFAFGDQLVWGAVLGVTLLLVPAEAGMGATGRNLIVFFGALYVLRGYGIYAWFVSRRAAVASVVAAIVVFPLSLVTVPAALGLGLSDTWLDWRRRLVHPPGRRPLKP